MSPLPQHSHTSAPPLLDAFMPTRTLLLSEAQFSFIDAQAKRGGFGSGDEYLCGLIAMEMDRQAMQDMMVEGIDSGGLAPFDQRFFVDLVEYAKARDKERSSPNLY
ncbi:hypothetical protein ACNI65_00320 [Roseateles sp. So40a]|uniref:hypothetical protein n=1 Tax=Roseateles sp. So40a TaxID=3400226 RepID=UPI003A84952B